MSYEDGRGENMGMIRNSERYADTVEDKGDMGKVIAALYGRGSLLAEKLDGLDTEKLSALELAIEYAAERNVRMLEHLEPDEEEKWIPYIEKLKEADLGSTEAVAKEVADALVRIAL